MSHLTALCLIGALAAAAAMPVYAQSVAYSNGRADRTAYEHWFGSLEPAEHDGATFWAAQRSKPHPPPCTARGDLPNSSWVAGCLSAQIRLAPADKRRGSEPEYRLGWNAYQQTPSPAATQSVPNAAQELIHPSPLDRSPEAPHRLSRAIWMPTRPQLDIEMPSRLAWTRIGWLVRHSGAVLETIRRCCVFRLIYNGRNNTT